MAAKLKFIKSCINQDTGRLIKAGDEMADLSDFEIGRHLAEGNAVPVSDATVERAVKTPPETRRRRTTGRKKKNVTNGR